MRELAIFLMGIATVSTVFLIGFTNWLYLQRKQKEYAAKHEGDDAGNSLMHSQKTLLLKEGDTIRINALPDGSLALTRMDRQSMK